MLTLHAILHLWLHLWLHRWLHLWLDFIIKLVVIVIIIRIIVVIFFIRYTREQLVSRQFCIVSTRVTEEPLVHVYKASKIP